MHELTVKFYTRSKNLWAIQIKDLTLYSIFIYVFAISLLER